VNPFAKKAAPVKAAAPAVNPFASKTTSKTRDLGAKGSFFGRVEGSEPAKPKPKALKAGSTAPLPGKAAAPPGVTAGSKDGTRQTFLFNKAPSAEAAAKPRKRKSDAVEDAAADLGASVSRRKDASEARELPREGEEFEETPETATEGESQSEGASRSGLARTATEVIMEDDEGEGEGVTQEATQVDDGEPEEPVAVAKAAVVNGGGLSKLERFRNAAA